MVRHIPCKSGGKGLNAARSKDFSLLLRSIMLHTDTWVANSNRNWDIFRWIRQHVWEKSVYRTDTWDWVLVTEMRSNWEAIRQTAEPWLTWGSSSSLKKKVGPTFLPNGRKKLENDLTTLKLAKWKSMCVFASLWYVLCNILLFGIQNNLAY